jgi:hypothetical protein
MLVAARRVPVITYDSRSCRICSNCSAEIMICWFSWTRGLSVLSQLNIRAAEAARSRKCDMLLTSIGFSALAAASAALTVACASPVFVRSSSSLCVAISTSPGFDCKLIAFALAFVAPRYGRTNKGRSTGAYAISINCFQTLKIVSLRELSPLRFLICPWLWRLRDESLKIVARLFDVPAKDMPVLRQEEGTGA